MGEAEYSTPELPVNQNIEFAPACRIEAFPAFPQQIALFM